MNNSKRKNCRPTTSPSPSPVILLAYSCSWQAALKQANFQCPTVWALDENDLVAEAIRYPHAAVVVELAANRSEHLCKLRSLLWSLRGIFVVGDSQIRSAEKSLRSLGIVDVFYAPANLKRLVLMIKRHNQSHQGPQESLEEEIERNLPWS